MNKFESFEVFHNSERIDQKVPEIRVVPKCRYEANDGTCVFNVFGGRGMPSLAVFAEDPRTSLYSERYVPKTCRAARQPDRQVQCDQYDGNNSMNIR